MGIDAGAGTGIKDSVGAGVDAEKSVSIENFSPSPGVILILLSTYPPMLPLPLNPHIHFPFAFVTSPL